MQLLVCGGAGYIGSHMAMLLAERGHRVTVLDDLSTGHREAVRWGPLVECALQDTHALSELFRTVRFDGVLHFAARSQVAESSIEPALYYRNNVAATLNLLEAMRRHGVDRLVFSSTAAVYGAPRQIPIVETHPPAPISPYGESKRMVEAILADYARAYGLRSVALRYFNAAGADREGRIGENHDPETHLIPNALRAAAGEQRLRVFGDAHPTPDGTCVRDYVHVEDLCEAHLLALELLEGEEGHHCFNLGNGNGFSVREVIEEVARVTGRPGPFDLAPPRPGDPPLLVADSRLARERLRWRPRLAGLDAMVESAWRWERRRRQIGRSVSGEAARA